MTTPVRTGGPAADSLGQPLFPGIRPGGTAAEAGPPPAAWPARVIDMPAEDIPELTPADYAGATRKIMHGRNRNVGVVLSVVLLLPADGQPMIDATTVGGPYGPRLANPPAHVVLPPQVFTVQWKRMTLRYVWILSNAQAVYPVGGVLFLPVGASAVAYLVTFNVGSLDDRRCTNIHHAEMQAVRWVNEQPAAWKARLRGIGIWNLSRRPGLGYSPCNACCADLAHFLTALRAAAGGLPREASIAWLTRYDRNARCGHPTDTANLRRLAASGWHPCGPGWTPCPAPRQPGPPARQP